MPNNVNVVNLHVHAYMYVHIMIINAALQIACSINACVIVV